MRIRSAVFYWLSGWCSMGAVWCAYQSRPIAFATLTLLGMLLISLGSSARFAEEHAMLRGKIDCAHCLGWRRYKTDLTEQCPVCEVVRDAYFDGIGTQFPHRHRIR